MVCEEKWWSNPCDSKNDVRYNDNVSPDISNLNSIFSEAHGLWKGSIDVYDGNLTLAEPSYAIDGLFPAGPLPYSPTGDTFFNITIAGTRWEQHDIYVYGAARQSWCDANPNVIPGLSNVGDDGVCGENGVAHVSDAFKTSTHEKNDILVGVSGTGSYQIFSDNFEWTIIPSGAEQLVEVVQIGFSRSTYTYTFSPSFNDLIVEFTNYSVQKDDLPETINRIVFKLKREEDESAWLQSIENSMIDRKVTANTMATYGTVPTTGQCANEEDVGCPTLQMWCDRDDASPLCGSTPYVEETTVNASVVTGFAFAVGAVIISAVVFLMRAYNKKKLAEEKERLKNEFAKRVVATFAIGSGSEAITMEAITEEFKRIDSGKTDGGDGMISKAEMKAFLVSSDVRNSLLRNSVGGQMQDHDFETLFALIDEDGSGQVDFAEFSAFMGHIKENIDAQAENFNEA